MQGFAQTTGGTTTKPVAIAKRADKFIKELNAISKALPASQWAITETLVRIVP
jgi:hypothetical protein